MKEDIPATKPRLPYLKTGKHHPYQDEGGHPCHQARVAVPENRQAPSLSKSPFWKTCPAPRAANRARNSSAPWKLIQPYLYCRIQVHEEAHHETRAGNLFSPVFIAASKCMRMPTTNAKTHELVYYVKTDTNNFWVKIGGKV
jgi:hypothetical protein